MLENLCKIYVWDLDEPHQVKGVVKTMLTQAGGSSSMAPSHDNLLGTRERRACVPEGELLWARGTGDLGPANAESPVLLLGRWAGTARYRGQRGKAVHYICRSIYQHVSMVAVDP